MVLGHLVQFFWVWQFQGVPPPFRRVVANSYLYRWVSGRWPPTGTVTSSAWTQGPWQQLRQVIPGDVTAWGLDVLLPVDGGVVISATSNNQPGLRPVGRRQTATCVCGILKGALRGHAYTGRKLWGPVSIQDTAGDELTPAGLAAWQAATAWVTQDLTYQDGADMQVLRPVIWSRSRTPGPPFSAPAEGTDLTSCTLNRTLSFLKHRRERIVR